MSSFPIRPPAQLCNSLNHDATVGNNNCTTNTHRKTDAGRTSEENVKLQGSMAAAAIADWQKRMERAHRERLKIDRLQISFAVVVVALNR